MRAAGEEVGDSLSVLVDSTPPVTSVSSSLNLVPSGGAAVVTTTTGNISFAFSALDAAPVNYTCFVTVTDGLPGSSPAPYFRCGTRRYTGSTWWYMAVRLPPRQSGAHM